MENTYWKNNFIPENMDVEWLAEGTFWQKLLTFKERDGPLDIWAILAFYPQVPEKSITISLFDGNVIP